MFDQGGHAACWYPNAAAFKEPLKYQDNIQKGGFRRGKSPKRSKPCYQPRLHYHCLPQVLELDGWLGRLTTSLCTVPNISESKVAVGVLPNPAITEHAEHLGC